MGASLESTGVSNRPPRNAIGRRLKPQLLALEDRRLLSTFDVSNTADDGSTGTLRWAVEQADVATTPSTIDFQLGNTPATITLLRGALQLSNTAEPTTINGPGTNLLSVNGNKADGVFKIDPQVTAMLSGLTITGDTAGNQGGGVDNAGALMLSRCAISGNSAQYGGGLFNEGTATLTDCTISGNTSTFEGAGIYNDGSLALTGSTIGGNTSHELGGGLQNKGTATLTNCNISGNSTLDNGGGVYNNRTVTLTNCTISGDTAQGNGGGLTNYGSATLTNCTISSNSAQRSGGGVSNSGNGPGNQTTLVLTACTITGDTAPQGGGLYNHKGLVNQAVATLTDTIVAGNRGVGVAPSDIGGREATSVTGSFSLVGTGGSGGIRGGVQGNIVLASLAGLGLASPGDYGGPTSTIALLGGSAAIGKGTAIAGITTDQRGFALDAPAPDIGAFQTSPAPLVVRAATDNGSPPGELDLRAAVNLADIATGDQTITFDPTSFATRRTITLTDGPLDVVNTTGTMAIEGPGANLLSINGNKADRVFKIDLQSAASISGLTITGGATIGFGGGLYNMGTATLTDCSVSNSSAGYGGGIFSEGTLTLDDCTISGNSAAVEGGGAWTAGTATLTGCKFMGNSSGDIGGALNNRSAQLTMTGCSITSNSAQDFGGGFYNQATATITDCTISGNVARINGGGLVTGIHGVSALTACTISGNNAQDGGALENYATTTLTNCTISGNNASASGGGVSNSGMATLVACTISGNVASVSGGGFYNHDFLDNRGLATLTDTIVAGNILVGGAASDLAGREVGRVTGSFNLVGTGGSGGIQGGLQGNIVLANLSGLGLAPLGDYGGPTQTIALLPGSPAIGLGTAINSIATDQRGEPDDAPIDIGAFQSQGYILTAAPGTTPQSAPTGEVFASPLAVTVVARNPSEPVAGGIVSFTVTPEIGTGAGADLSTPTAVIGANQRAQVSATANTIEGTYVVTASSAGAHDVLPFTLTNLHNDLIQLQFTGLSNERVTFGTTTSTFSGTLTSGAQAPPPGEIVAVTLGGVTQQAAIGPGGVFASTFATARLNLPGSPYLVCFDVLRVIDSRLQVTRR
jgi:predicted outer membrane repeat protein